MPDGLGSKGVECMTHEEMLEEAARREAALDALDKLYDETL